MQIKESDWKVFRKLSKNTLNRFCERILQEIAEISSRSEVSCHERYLEVFKLIQERDEVALMFDNPSRSKALSMIMAMYAHDVLSVDDLMLFSQELRDYLKRSASG